MSNFLKPLVILIISCLIFAGVAYLLDEDILDFMQTRFYNPSIVKSYIDENEKDAVLSQEFLFELQEKFGQTLHDPSVRSSFLYNQSAEDIFQRSRIYGILMESTTGLQSVRFIDANGIRIHFSTSDRDIITQNESSISYRNYTEDPLALPYETISVPQNGQPLFTMDEDGDRIIFSYPFNDSMDVYHGTALFTVSIRALADKLVAEGRLKVNENVSVIGQPPGVLFGSPVAFKQEINKKVAEVWSNGIKDRVTIDSESSGSKFSLISVKTQPTGEAENNIIFGRLVNDDLFYISDSMKNILYISMFLTFYLALFFIINFKPGPATVVRNRIRRLRDTLFEKLYEDKSTQEKIRWLLELEQRRDEVKSELKYKLKFNKKTEKHLDDIIDKSWDEIIGIVRANSGHAALALKIADLDAKEIVKKAEKKEEPEIIDEVDALEEVESLEEVEPLEDIEESETLEEVEALEEIEKVETLEDIEEVETLEDIEEAEALEEVETLEDIEEAETLDEVEEVETLEDIEEAEALEEVEEVEALEEIDTIEDIITLEEIEEVTPLEEVETLEEVEVLEEIEEVETLKEIEESVEAIDTAEEAKETESVDDFISFEEERITVKQAVKEHKEAKQAETPPSVKPDEKEYIVTETEEFISLENDDTIEEPESFEVTEAPAESKSVTETPKTEPEEYFSELEEFVEEVVLSPKFTGFDVHKEMKEMEDFSDNAVEPEEIEELPSLIEELEEIEEIEEISASPDNFTFDIENFIEILDNFDEELGLIAHGSSSAEQTVQEESVIEAPAIEVLEAEELEVEELEAIEEIEEITAEESIEEIYPVDGLIEEMSMAEESIIEEIPVTKSLLQFADNILENEITAEEISSAPSKSLLQLASKYETSEESSQAGEITLSKSLLLQASEYAERTPDKQEVLTATEVYPTSGLLARAISQIRLADSDVTHKTKTTAPGKGLLELASRIEFGGSITVLEETETAEETDVKEDIFSRNKIEDSEGKDDEIEMDIFFPLDDMFSSLKNIKTNED